MFQDCSYQHKTLEDSSIFRFSPVNPQFHSAQDRALQAVSTPQSKAESFLDGSREPRELANSPVIRCWLVAMLELYRLMRES